MTVRGTQIALGLFNETVYGQAPSPTPSGERAYIRTSGLRGEIAKIVDDTLAGRRGRQAGINGNKNVAGGIQIHLAPQSSLRWLAHIIGTPTTTGVGPYKHVFAVGAGALALPPGMTIEMDLGTTVGANRYIRFHGVRVRQAQFTFGSSGFAAVNLDLLGSNFELATTPLDATLDDHGHTAWSMFTATLQEGGAPIANVQQLGVTWNNDLDEDTFVIGGGGVRGELPEGFVIVNGTMSTLFKDTALLQKGINSTDTSLNIVLQNGTGDGTAGNEKFEMNIPHLRFAATTPEVQGPRGLRGQYNWEAHANGVAEFAGAVTIDNARAAH